MSFVEDIRVREERLAAGLGAEIDHPAAVFDARKICRVSIAELSSAEGHEAWELLSIREIERHTVITSVPLLR